jgi:Antibiotic biosynthesis monooxygenase
MSIVITCFEIPPSADLVVDAGPGGRVHRALAPDARFGYITVGEAEPVARLAGADGAPTALSGRYELYHSGASTAPPLVAGEGALTFVNCFVVAPGDEAAAFAVWSEVNAYMVAKPGYRWHRLHRRLTADAPFTFVNVVRWDTVEAWQAAHDDGFRALTGGPVPFRSLPTLTEELGSSVLPAQRDAPDPRAAAV